MMNQAIVRVHASGTVNPRDWERFKKMVLETTAIVKAASPGRVLLHECYYNANTYQCLITEAYEHEEAFLQHLDLIRPLAEKYKVDWTINRLEMLGSCSVNVIESMRRAYGKNVFFYCESI